MEREYHLPSGGLLLRFRDELSGDEHVLAAKTPEQKQEAVAITIDLCIEKGYLAEYLQAHRAEVEKIMMTMLSPEYVKLPKGLDSQAEQVYAFTTQHNTTQHNTTQHSKDNCAFSGVKPHITFTMDNR